MKKIIVALLCCISITAQAQHLQTGEVPAGIHTAFNKQFTGVSQVKWEKDTKGYEVTFLQSSKSLSATYGTDGNWLATRTPISATALPATAREYVQQNYAGVAIVGAAEVQLSDGLTNYEAKVNDLTLEFDGSGHFITVHKD